MCCGGKEGVAHFCFVLFQGNVLQCLETVWLAFHGVMVVTWNQQLREGTSTVLTVFSILWLYPGHEGLKASDPGRNSDWGRLRDKTNLRLAQGPPAVTSPGLGVRETTGNRKGRGRVGPWGPSPRQPWC